MEGMRKPEPEIYELTLDRLGVAGCQAVFLDDIPGNLRPAETLGISTILVRQQAAAVTELQQLLGRNLGHIPGTEKVRRGMELNEKAVADYFSSTLGVGDGPVRIKQFQHGQSNPTYLVQFQGRNLVNEMFTVNYQVKTLCYERNHPASCYPVLMPSRGSTVLWRRFLNMEFPSHHSMAFVRIPVCWGHPST